MPETIDVQISPEWLEQLQKLPDNTNPGHRGFAWTSEKDAALLRFWLTKNQRALSKAIGCSINTARDRYVKLIREQGETV